MLREVKIRLNCGDCDDSDYDYPVITLVTGHS